MGNVIYLTEFAVDGLAADPETYAKKPGRDFTRNRLRIMLEMRLITWLLNGMFFLILR